MRPPKKPPLIIAHRGASADAPENTLAAFALAWEQGADAIETDLRLTADGVIVAHHDPLPPGATHAQLPAHIPLLPAILATIPPGKTAVLELKELLVPDLGAFPPERVTLIAFDPFTLATAKRALPGCRALLLFADYARLPSPDWLVREVQELGVDGVDLHFTPAVTPALLAPLRAAGLTVLAYTLNATRAVRRAAALGLDGITTDHPAAARRWLGGF